MNYYKRHIGDYIKDTAHLSLLEHGVYTRLLDVYYSREIGIPDEQVGRLIGARSKEEFRAIQSVLKEFFVNVDGVWRQSRCDQEIAAKNEKAEKNREVGKLGGRPGGSKQKPSDNHDGFKNNHDGSKNNPSHKPIANNQESKSGGDPRTQIFELGKSILGASSGGLISKAISQTNEATVFAVLGEMAAKPTADPRSYFVAATKPRQRGVVV